MPRFTAGMKQAAPPHLPLPKALPFPPPLLRLRALYGEPQHRTNSPHAPPKPAGPPSLPAPVPLLSALTPAILPANPIPPGPPNRLYFYPPPARRPAHPAFLPVLPSPPRRPPSPRRAPQWIPPQTPQRRHDRRRLPRRHPLPADLHPLLQTTRRRCTAPLNTHGVRQLGVTLTLANARVYLLVKLRCSRGSACSTRTQCVVGRCSPRRNVTL